MRNEKATQNRVVQLLTQKLGYTYLGNLEDRMGISNVIEISLNINRIFENLLTDKIRLV